MADETDTNKEDPCMDFSIRDTLVNTAVNFLLNPDVQKRNHDNKVEFLKKKGLTDAEITAAFERAKFDSRFGSSPSSDQLNRSVRVNIPPHYQPYSFWSRLSRISSSLIVFGVAIYGLHHFYKKFVKPWLLGKEAEHDPLTDSVMQLTESLTVLTESVSRLETIVAKQNEDLDKVVQIMGGGYTNIPVILEDIKRETNSLKSILISRHQFPAMPQIQNVKATIPQWQLPENQNHQLIFPEAESKAVDLATSKPSLHTSGPYQTPGVSDPMSITNRYYFRRQTYETPESSYAMNNATQNGDQGNVDLTPKSREADSLDANFHFSQLGETHSDASSGVDEETVVTRGADSV